MGRRDDLIEVFGPGWSGAVPYIVLLSPEGEVLRAEVDRIDPLAWRMAIVAALNGRKPWCGRLDGGLKGVAGIADELCGPPVLGAG